MSFILFSAGVFSPFVRGPEFYCLQRGLASIAALVTGRILLAKTVS